MTLWTAAHTPSFPVLHYLPEFAQTHVHCVHPTISSSATLFSFCPQSLLASGSFPMSNTLLTSGNQSITVLSPCYEKNGIHSEYFCMTLKYICAKEMFFSPVVMYGCESWTVKKAEHRRIDAFELWCWRRPLRVPLTARRSNQSILKEISPGISLEGMMLKLKLQYFGHLM